jgi:ketosteroid isomerase-like protein
VSDSNIEVVRRGYEAMQRMDIDALLEMCDPEVTFVSLVGQLEGTVYEGREGIRRFFADLLEVWDVWEPRPLRYEEAGDAVLVTGTSLVRGTGSGLEMTVEWGQVFRLRDGKVLWSRMYSDLGQARVEFQSTSA